ncbi:zinc metallopeptidase [Deinococcus sonorensis]|uniref:Zinc metallopeptidase n=2 Tax=Deinococcus sonorensis TaxID=309891 RepID=A0AAU7UAA2_9DEIO
MIFGPYTLLILLIFAASLLIQGYLSRTYAQWSQVRNARNLSGAEVARRMLDQHGLQQVQIELAPGRLSDHYDPQRKVVRLSADNYRLPSLAAAAVAAHEVGHALQDHSHMPALALRSQLAVPLGLGMNWAPWLLLLGITLHFTGLIWLGVLLFGAALAFHLITLPVEFDASRRALTYLSGSGLLSTPELQGARTVLTAAALTYVAGFAMALVQFLNVLGLARNRS